MALLTTGKACSRCYGTRQLSEFDNEPCRSCRRTGRELTEIGREAIDFLEEHFDLKPKERD